MKRRSIAIVLVVTVILVGYQFIPADPTQADLIAVGRLVGKRTSDAILHIQSLPSGAVEVTTGWAKGRLEGAGETLRLRKFFGLWWVISKSHWAA